MGQSISRAQSTHDQPAQSARQSGIKLAKKEGLATAPELMGSLLCARAQGLTLKAGLGSAKTGLRKRTDGGDRWGSGRWVWNSWLDMLSRFWGLFQFKALCMY